MNVKIRAVLFDVGGTLIKSLPAPEIHKRILEAHGIRVTLDAVAKAHAQNQREFDPQKMGKEGSKYWIAWNVRLLENLGINADKEFLSRKIDELWWDYSDLQTFPNAREVLDELRKREIKLGIVTNGLERDLQHIFKKVDIGAYFDVVVAADTCCNAKPKCEIFRYALNKLNVRPEEALYVGDSYEYDFQGAKKAGLKSLLIDRSQNIHPCAETIDNLNRIFDYI